MRGVYPEGTCTGQTVAVASCLWVPSTRGGRRAPCFSALFPLSIFLPLECKRGNLTLSLAPPSVFLWTFRASALGQPETGRLGRLLGMGGSVCHSSCAIILLEEIIMFYSEFSSYHSVCSQDASIGSVPRQKIVDSAFLVSRWLLGNSTS